MIDRSIGLALVTQIPVLQANILGSIMQHRKDIPHLLSIISAMESRIILTQYLLFSFLFN
jgi:hypothetical protein